MNDALQNHRIDKSLFKFQYLPEYAGYLLSEKLQEFATVGIRFCREADLPMLRPMAKYSEDELVHMSLASHREVLTALSKNDIATHIEKTLHNWSGSKPGTAADKPVPVLHRSEVRPEDITLTYYIRRKIFGFFLYSYTQNAVTHMLIANEVDKYTTYEELISLKAYLASGRETQPAKTKNP